jgi:hypothetical protein
MRRRATNQTALDLFRAAWSAYAAAREIAHHAAWAVHAATAEAKQATDPTAAYRALVRARNAYQRARFDSDRLYLAYLATPNPFV